MNIALKESKRVWSAVHSGDLQGKLEEAKRTLLFAHEYIEEYAKYANRLANTPLKQEDFEMMVNLLFPIDENRGTTHKNSVQRMRNEVMYCYYMPDIKKFQGTQWGALNAVSDFVGHSKPRKNTATYAENRWSNIMNGHQLMDNLMSLMAVKK